MNLSGILVVAVPERCDEVAEALAAMPGIEVHQKDPATGKIVVVQEALTIQNEVESARELQRIPGVLTVNMVYHYFADGEVKELDPTVGESVVSSMSSMSH